MCLALQAVCSCLRILTPRHDLLVCSARLRALLSGEVESGSWGLARAAPCAASACARQTVPHVADPLALGGPEMAPGQHEDCEHSFVLGSDKNLALRFAAARWHEEDAASGLGAHARGRDAPTSQPPRGSAGADEFEHGVSVYVDERLVGVAHGGHFNLSGLLPGMHTLQIVARDEMGNDQEVCALACADGGARRAGRARDLALDRPPLSSPRTPPCLLPRTPTSQTQACFGSVT